MTPVRQRMTEDMQVRNLSPHTQASYIQQVSLFARYLGKSPELLGPEQIRAYQIYLTNERKLATSSILIAISALRFLYKVTLHRNWTLEDIETIKTRGQLRGQEFRHLWSESREPVAKRVGQAVVQHRGPHCQKRLHRPPIPSHLLTLRHPFGDDLIDRRFHP